MKNDVELTEDELDEFFDSRIETENGGWIGVPKGPPHTASSPMWMPYDENRTKDTSDDDATQRS